MVSQPSDDDTPADTLDVKIVSLDHYRPRPDHRRRCNGPDPHPHPHPHRPPGHPVVRVFGITKHTREKIAVHVHGVLPYFFVPMPVDLDGMVASGRLRAVERVAGERLEVHFGRVFWKALDGALELHHACYGGGDGAGAGRVADVLVVRATAFYGYHKHATLWLKVYVYDPVDVKRAASLVGSGAVLGVRFQPHESHIPFLLQFKIDHNLYGMDWMRLRGGRWRGDGGGGPRQTTCALELDVDCRDIVNTYDKKRVDITAAPIEEQVVDSLVPMWAAERQRQGRWDVGPTPVEVARRVAQIDSVTVAYWRERFREAEEKRADLEKKEEKGKEKRERGGTGEAADSPPSLPFSQPYAPSQQQQERQQEQQQLQQSAVSDPALLGSLVDADAVRATQWTGPTLGALTSRTGRPVGQSQYDGIDDPIDSYTERQRDMGYMWRENQGGGFDEEEDERLMELAGLIREGEAVRGGTQRPGSQLDKATAPTRYSFEQRVQSVLHEGSLSAQNECHDIMEASQVYDAEVRLAENTVAGGSGGREAAPATAVATAPATAPATAAATVSTKREREQVLEAGRRLSEIRQLWRTSAGGGGSTMPPPPPKKHGHDDDGKGNEYTRHEGSGAMTSQDRMDFWSEPASQVALVDGDDDDDDAEADMDKNKSSNDNSHNQMDHQGTISSRAAILEPARRPPSRLEVAAMPVVHTAPHYGNAADMSKRTQIFGGKVHHLKSSSVSEMPRFGADQDHLSAKLAEFHAAGSGAGGARLIELPQRPPTRDGVNRWVTEMRLAQANMRRATAAAVVGRGPALGGPADPAALAAMLDSNSGKFLPNPSADTTSQASLMGTPLLPSWHGDEVTDDSALDLGLAHPAWTQTNPATASNPSNPATASNPSNPSTHPTAPATAANPNPSPAPASTMTPPPRPSIQPASPKYDEIDALYKDVFVGPDAGDHGVVRRGSSRMHPHTHQHRQSFSQISWGGSHPHATDVTPESQMGMNPFKNVSGKGEGLMALCVEVHAESRQGLLPDPARDAVCAAILTVYDDCETVASGQYYTRIIMVKQRERVWPNFEGMQDVDFDFVSSEGELFARFRESVVGLDPDMLVGFEIQNNSLGYMADRSRCAFENASFLSDISRVPSERVEVAELGENDQYGWDHDSGIRVAGRIVLNMWRTIRAEVKLQSYSFENCVASILKIRVPHVKRPALHGLFKRHETRWRCLSHYVLCNRLCLHMIEQLDFIRRTSELARTFGIDFFSVISRGSQYRVESMMVRLAHSQNYIALSPNNEQVARQPAMEALPLVMEPVSGMYEDPVCVLDFQSLYPSMIIAYNLCFSTCIGRPKHLFREDGEDGGGPPAAAAAARPDATAAAATRNRTKKSTRLGCRESFSLDSSLAANNIDPVDPNDLIVTPNGIGFVPPSHRRGVLPRLLHEILQTRIMIKSAMRNAPADAKSLCRSLNAKQFALKLIANVTYGYTAAGFSGRMPMAELADAIVQSGRETLEDTIRFIKTHPDWREFADVIYGDTDSIFVRLKGRTLEEAHRIGQDIAKAVTARNPDPVLLKLEKVYHPCFLLSKKRYVGAMYERPDQARFQFDAKGIETVRRDSCPAVSKIVEQSLRILFTSADISAVKAYVERQWKRIISGRVSVMDFIFAKEVRLGTYAGETSNASSIPPAALVATKAMAKDPRREPRFGERVSYVVVHGDPGARLIDMVVEPETLVESGGTLRLHAAYYITKQINPALERFMRLIGVDVQIWYSRIPKAMRLLPHKRPLSSLGVTSTTATNPKSTIDQFYLSRHCICCDALTRVNEPLCCACQADRQLVALALPLRLNRIERQRVHLGRICGACGGVGGRGEVVCESLDCAVYFERRKVEGELMRVVSTIRVVDDE